MSFKQILAWIKSELEREPAAWAYGINALIGPAAVAFHWPQTTATIVLTSTTALATIYTAVRARPVSVAAVVGGVMAIATAVFGSHLDPQVAGELSSGLSAVLALVFRANLTPVADLRRSAR